jgi:predicted nucleic acid-binding protein
MAALYTDVLASRRPLVTTNYVLSELAALLTTRARAPRVDILAYLRDIRTDPQVHIVHVDSRLDEDAWDLLDQMLDKDWSLVDAASFVVMRRLGIAEALTTDHHFTQAGFVRLPGD